ncbi:PLP-dependent aminotransferase family protein [Calothrix sp. PCC 7507]|uniref:aminotransferase-like domain-containing protein n=1 Tax=Calothrix sp. PCC 7507 TaxID=99598 RepID=UPI00029EFE5E|nr:PLP-dependent aminotransferase family protein [Calothrix sp. PCC 7507]AFY32766.1 putative transcriptional regulator, GntR family [Calothrix sp. PCC 7507]
MAYITPAYQIADLFAERARNLIPQTYGTELTKIITVSFTYGLADPSIFPHAELAAASVAVLDQEAAVALNYGPPSPQLYEQLILRLQTQGILADRSRILIGYGSAQILGLLADVLIESGDVVIVEGPTFLGVVGRFKNAGARILSIPIDDLGMNVDALEATLIDLQKQGIRPKFIYTIPTFHNPTGTTMPLFRRKKLVALAAEYGVLVVEDDAYSDLRFSGEAVASLASLDEAGWVLYVSTFSKIIVPGVRLGWACGHPAIIERLAMFKSEGPVGPFISHVIGRYCASGNLDLHIQKLIACYRHKCDLMLDAIAHNFPDDVVINQPDGGFFVWCQLPPDISAKALLSATSEYGVTFLPGTRCYANGQGDDAIRLAFSFQPMEKITEGIGILGDVIRKLRH